MLFQISAKENPPRQLSRFVHTVVYSHGKWNIDGATVPSSTAFMREMFDVIVWTRFSIDLHRLPLTDCHAIYMDMLAKLSCTNSDSNDRNRFIFNGGKAHLKRPRHIRNQREFHCKLLWANDISFTIKNSIFCAWCWIGWKLVLVMGRQKRIVKGMDECIVVYGVMVMI